MKGAGRFVVGAIPDLMALAGLGLVIEGSWRIYPPAALIVAGVGITAVSFLAARRGV